MKPSALVTLLVLVALLVGGFFLVRKPGPVVTLSPGTGTVSPRREMTVKLAAPAGVQGVTVTALQGGKGVEVLTKSYPAGMKEAAETFTLAAAGLKDGPFTLKVHATTPTKFRFGGGTTDHTHSFTCDVTPLTVSVLTTAHNISRGGTGLVIYTVSKEVQKTGVVFGDRFIPGFRQEGNVYACLFPFPYDQDPEKYVPRVLAVDKAGNERLAGINYHLIPKTFPADRIVISDRFLEKVATDFKNDYPQEKTPLDVFLKVNRELRQKDAKAVVEYGRQTSPLPLWQGEFIRMANSAPMGVFAQTRIYVYQGQTVDQQTHLGIDLASLAHARVPAANNGTVVYAGDLGLYGQCLVIDHGLGLQTLYGHLSQIGVKAGDTVQKGQIVAATGATGMAAGDHLHFGVLVAGEPVNPIEWWDRSWLEHNVTSKLKEARALVPATPPPIPAR